MALYAVVGALGEVLQALTRSNVSLPQVLQIVIERAVELCGADAGDLDVREGDAIRSVAFVGFTPDYEQTVRNLVLKADRGSVTGRAFLEGRLVQVADVLADPEYQLQDSQRQGGYRTVLVVPLLSESAPLGVLTILRNRVAAFSEHEIRLVSLFADQAAIAIHAAALMTETRQALASESAVSQVLQARNCSLVIGARSPPCLRTSGVSLPLPRLQNPKKSWACCASTTPPWATSP